MKKFALIAFLIFSFSTFVFAQTNKKAEIKRVNAYVKTIDAFSEKNENPNLVFADVSDYNQLKPKWKKYDSKKEFEKAQETASFFNVAYAWQKKGKIILAVFTLSSPSGDWAKYVYLYFREDGTLAKSETELRTFYGRLSISQDFYFDGKGRLLKKTREYKDLTTDKPKKPSEDDLDANSYSIGKGNYYKTTSRLPFASLLRKRK